MAERRKIGFVLSIRYSLFARSPFHRWPANDIIRGASLSPLRRPRGAQSGRPRLHRPPHRRPRACRRHARVADAAGRHRCGRGPVAGGFARVARRDQHHVGATPRRNRRMAQIRHPARTIAGHAWSGKYRGQTQKWFALRFTGNESEIDIVHPAGGHEPEFVEWRWEKLQRLPELVVPFKRGVYERVVTEFAKFAGAG